MINKIQNVQALRGIAVLLVLMVHIGLVETKYSAFPLLSDYVQFGMSGVDIFFVISGFIMMSLSMHQKKDISYAFKFLYARIIRIYPIYWFYSLLILIVFIFYPEWVNSSTSGEIDLVKSFFLFPQNTPPLLQVGWTLIHEIYFYVGFFCILLFFKSNDILFRFSMIWAILVILLNSIFNFTDPIMKIIFHPLTLEFLGGISIAYFGRKIDINLSSNKLKGIFLIVLLLFFVNYVLFENIYNTPPFGWWRVVLFGLPSMVLLLIALKLEDKRIIFPHWLVVIGDRSYTIYLSHLLVINVVGRVWHYLSFDSIASSILFVVLLIIFTLIYGKYAYEWIEVPMLKRLKKLNVNVRER